MEMARAAIETALGVVAAEPFVTGQTRLRLKNIVWVRPIAVNGPPVQVQIGIHPEENGELAFEIYGDHETDQEPVVYSQGSGVLGPVAEIPDLDLKSLQVECSQNCFTGEQIYAAFKKLGIEYGPGYQGVGAVYVGRGQILAKLSLPASVSMTHEQYMLHPSIMEAALQAAIRFTLSAKTINSVTDGMPFSPDELQELEIFEKCSSEMWALIRNDINSKAMNSSNAPEGLPKLTIDLCDGQGKICVRMKGYTTRSFNEAHFSGT